MFFVSCIISNCENPHRRRTLSYEITKDKPELYQYLLPYSRGARCTFPGWKCDSPCVFGGYGAMIRNI